MSERTMTINTLDGPRTVRFEGEPSAEEMSFVARMEANLSDPHQRLNVAQAELILELFERIDALEAENAELRAVVDR